MVWLGLLPLGAKTGEAYRSDRLSNSMIIRMFQDHYGFMWIGTEYGLNRYDGYHYTSYLHDRHDSTSIVDNTVVSFLDDSEHNLWIGTNRGLCRYSYATNSFTRYAFPNGVNPRVTAMVENKNGDIYIGTSGYYGLYVLRKGSKSVSVAKEFGVKDKTFVYDLFEDDRGNLWKCNHLTDFGYYTMKNGRPAGFKAFRSSVGPINRFHQMGRGRVLVVCLYGILEYNYATGTLKKSDYVLPQLSGNISIRSSHIDSRGNLYIGIKSLGLMMIPAGKQVAEVVKSTNPAQNLGSANVVDIVEDRTHNLWVGTYDQGTFIVNKERQSFDNWSFSTQNYRAAGSTTSIVDAGDGGVWCAVRNNGIYRFDRQGRVVGHPRSPRGTNIIYRDRQGDYWIGTENVLFAYNPTTGASQERAKFDGWGITCMADDGRGNLYVSNFGKGLIIYNKATGHIRSVSMSQKSKLGNLSNDWIESILIDHRGLVWLSTTNGLSCMDPRTGSFMPFGWRSQLEDVHCTNLYQSARYGILIGTAEGLFRFNEKTRRVEAFPGTAPLVDKVISAIAEDEQGRLWLSTTMGIWEYSPKSRRFIAHIKGDGLSTHEYTYNAVLRMADGMVAFGTGDGLTVFYPKDVKAGDTDLGPIYLTNFVVGDRYEDIRQDRFDIAYADNYFYMEFSLLDFRNADNISFEYSVNGGNWISIAEGSNRISFYRLKPGRYTVSVRAVNNGVASKTEKTITLVVSPPWYASWWAYLIYMALAGGLVTVGILVYMRRKQVEMDESKMRFLINATHDIRSPLTLILGPLTKLKTKVSDDESKGYLDTIDRNAQRLLLLVNQILDERKIDMNQMKLHCAEISLVDLIAGIKSLFQYNANERGIALRFVHDDGDVKAWVDKDNFDKVVSNLLSNAFKFTPDGGEIVIGLHATATHAVMTVEDNGAGFGDEHLEHLFDRFYQGKGGARTSTPGTGIGLNLCRSIVQMHGGTIRAMARNDGQSGAKFVVELPLGNAHLKPEQMEAYENSRQETATAPRQRPNQNVKVALVDDDLDLARYISNELSNWYHIDIFANGREALQALLRGRYDLVVSDIVMPEMDGVTLLKNIKGNTEISDVPVILLTSKSEIGDRLEGIREGADAYLSKPFNIDELRFLIANQIDNVRRLRGKFSGAQSQEGVVEQIEVKGNDDALMDRIMACVNANLANPDFNVESLMAEIGISRTQLHRKMKEITGISAGDFIRNLRLQQAARLIKEKKQNVTQIAYAVGFNSQSHFSSAFKKHFGMSPSEYAEQADTSEETKP